MSCELKRVIRIAVLLALLLFGVLVAACAPQTEPSDQVALPQDEGAAEARVALSDAGPYVLDGPLTLRAFAKDREVAPDTDQSYEFLVVNNTTSPVPVVMVLEHREGVRWHTSLCVESQCLLGDGTEASVTDPVTLPPFLELPFQAHLFVNEEAESGETAMLNLRIEPQVDGLEARSVTLSAVVAH